MTIESSQSFKTLPEKLEALIIGTLLLYYLGVDVAPDIIKLMNLVSYVMLAPLIILHWKRLLYVATRNLPMLLLVGMVIASVFWSASPDYTSNEIKAFLRATLLGVYIATRYSFKEQVRLLAWVFGMAIVLSLFFTLAVPSYGIHAGGGAAKGIFTFKNLLAAMMTIGGIFFILIALDSKKHSWLPWTVVIMAIAALALSQGKTAYSVFFLVLCLLPIRNVVKQQYKLRVVLFLIILLIGGSTIVLFLGNLEFILVDTLGKNMEFNGRLPIWTLMMQKVMERPWFGYGFVGFWTSDESLYVINNSWAGTGDTPGLRFNAHSGYIDLLLQLGFLGMVLYIVDFFAVLARGISLLFLTPIQETFWILPTLLALLFFNFADTLSVVTPNSLWSIYVSIGLSTIVQHNRIKRDLHLNAISSLPPNQVTASYPIVNQENN